MKPLDEGVALLMIATNTLLWVGLLWPSADTR